MNQMKQRKATVVKTVPLQLLYWEKEELPLISQSEAWQAVHLYPALEEQEWEGMGGAFTEASAHVFASLNKEGQQDFLESYFGQDGLRYQFGRIPIHSCDFSLSNYTYIQEGDQALETFSVERDEKEVLPLLHKAMETAAVPMTFLASPWSPPAFMKDNQDMNHGGKLLAEYRENWAAYIVKFIQEYAKRGIPITYLTVQNEPMAVQTWDSCLYSPEEEGVFLTQYLKPALEAAGLGHVQVLIWDHNKDEMVQRTNAVFGVEGCRASTAGVAIHWYTGDHFDSIRAVRRLYPEQKIFFTEGCVEYSRFGGSDEIEKAQMYAHDILGDLKAGCNAFIDWNLLLDEKGGPNHVGNYCAAPVMADGKGGVRKQLSYYYMGHFSRFLQKGAKQIMTSVYTSQLEVVAFRNPDQTTAAILFNPTDKEIPVHLCMEGESTSLSIPSHSIYTVVLPG
jgi:glucosylceramidase